MPEFGRLTLSYHLKETDLQLQDIGLFVFITANFQRVHSGVILARCYQEIFKVLSIFVAEQGQKRVRLLFLGPRFTLLSIVRSCIFQGYFEERFASQRTEQKLCTHARKLGALSGPSYLQQIPKFGST